MGKDSQNIVSSKANQCANNRFIFVNFSKRSFGPINVSDNKFNSQGSPVMIAAGGMSLMIPVIPLDDMSIDTGPAAVHKRFVTVTKETISRESLRKHYSVAQIGCENL